MEWQSELICGTNELMKIMLTGATGLIGKELGKKLIEKGHELVILSRSPDRAQNQIPFPAEVHAWDGLTGDLPPHYFSGVDAVIHLAGESVGEHRWSDSQKKKILDSRTLGTRTLVQAIQKYKSNPDFKVQHFISSSAIGYYGQKENPNELLTEKSQPGDDFLAQVCVAWENESVQLREIGVRVAHVRTGIVLSRQGGAMKKLLPLFSHGMGSVLGDGQQWMSWIHIDDMVAAYLLILENDKIHGAVNAVAPNPVTNQEFSTQLAKALGSRLFIPVPKFALKLSLGEMAAIVLNSQKVDSIKLESFGFHFLYPHLDLALRQIVGGLQKGEEEFFSEQWLPRSPNEVFPYFCDEKNLEELTPEFLNFKVLKKSTPEISKGTLIDYELSLHGISVKWRTLIEVWEPGVRFVDTQIKGPYKKWHHTHEFIKLGHGTLMRDRVIFSLPGGFLGKGLAGWKVGNDVQKIFNYRRAVILQRFPQSTRPLV
jgi:uncharacterized protein (TIGR01777 family)